MGMQIGGMHVRRSIFINATPERVWREFSDIEIYHHGFERLGAAAADNLQGYESGWTINHLQALRSIVEA